MECVDLSGIRLPEVSLEKLRLPHIGYIADAGNPAGQNIYDAILDENGNAFVTENDLSYMCMENKVN